MTTTTDITPITIEAWADVQCTWCYIGKQRLRRGVEAYGGPVEIHYRTFGLQPDAPLEFDGSAFLREERGLEGDQLRSMQDGISRLGRPLGITYNWESIRPTNSSKAHQLIHYATKHVLQDQVWERLFKAYFTDGLLIGDPHVLVDIAEDLGLDRGDVARSLRADEYLPDVISDRAAGSAYGVTGVPLYVIGGKYALSGAQESTTFCDVLRRVESEQRESA